MDVNNLGPFKLNSSLGILWIIFYFPPTIKVKMGTFSYFLVFFHYFIMNTFITLYLFYLHIFLLIHSLTYPSPHNVFDVSESTCHPSAYMDIINWVNICLQFFLFGEQSLNYMKCTDLKFSVLWVSVLSRYRILT